MNTLEERLTETLQEQAERLPSASGDLSRVKRRGRRRVVGARLASAGAATAAIVAVVAVVSALGSGPADQSVADGGERVVFEDGYALTPRETTVRLVACLQRAGLDVWPEGNGITFDHRVVSPDRFESAKTDCEDRLRRSGFLLPGDNPEHLEHLYHQFRRLAECYRTAGLEISSAPGLEEFVASRQAGVEGWSPQTEALRQASPDEIERTEAGCDLPAPEVGPGN